MEKMKGITAVLDWYSSKKEFVRQNVRRSCEEVSNSSSYERKKKIFLNSCSSAWEKMLL